MKPYHVVSCVLAWVCILAAGAAAAPDLAGGAPAPSEMLLEQEYMSLDELLNKPMDVTSLKGLSARESPGIVSLVTADEIARTGARDLLDVLKLIPSFEPAVDVEGIIGLGIRGLWAQEGKVLLLWDGQPMNELLYGTMQLDQHFPAAQIQEIEIIRGPGSAIYGGYAELAVINIKTKNARQLNGLSAEVLAGRTEKTWGHQNLSLSFGKAFADFEITLHLYGSQGLPSDQEYTSFYGSAYDMADNSWISPYFINLSLNYKGLQFRGLWDDYRTKQRDEEGSSLEYPLHTDYETGILDLQYTWKLGEQLTLTPRINFKKQAPYKVTEEGSTHILVETMPAEPIDDSWEINAFKTTAGLTASYDLSEKDNLLLGLEACRTSADFYMPAGDSVAYDNSAAFAQALLDLGYFNFAAGARCEHHSQYGDSFVPRIGATKVIGDWSFKLLFSRAFKVPLIDNIRMNSAIKPEKAQVIECEIGNKLSDKLFATVNLFNIQIEDTIIYSVLESLEENYINAGTMGSRGAELNCQYRDDWGFVNFSYAYQRINSNEIDLYAVPGQSEILLGFPAHKITLSSKINLGYSLTLNPEIICSSQRFGYTRENKDVQTFSPTVVANLYLSCLPLDGLEVGAGVHDLANQNPPYLQPYNGGHAPLPGLAREWIAKAAYHWNF